MRCQVCNKENEGGACSRCGFHSVVSLDDGGHDLVKQAVLGFRSKLMAKIKIEEEVYSYKETDESEFIETVDTIVIFDGSKTTPDEGAISWYPEQFARNEAGSFMNLTIIISNDGKESRKEISIKAPEIASFWKVGVMYKGMLDYSIVFGNEENYVETDSFCIVG